MNGRRSPTILLSHAVLLALAACIGGPRLHKMPINHYFGDERDLQTVHRILVLPLQFGDDIEVDEELVRRSFIREINLLQRFQVEVIPTGEDPIKINIAFEHGDVSIPALVALAQRFHLDGVMVGRVTSYRPYIPPHMGIEARLFSLHTGSWVWIADGTFDSNSSVCMDDLHHYASTAVPRDGFSTDATRMILLSPGRFAAYACHRLLGTWRR